MEFTPTIPNYIGIRSAGIAGKEKQIPREVMGKLSRLSALGVESNPCSPKTKS
jgi:hypothetical protein